MRIFWLSITFAGTVVSFLLQKFRGACISFLYFKIKYIMSKLTSAYYYFYFLTNIFIHIKFIYSFIHIKFIYIVLRCTAQDSHKSETYNGDQPCNPGGGLNIFYFISPQLRWLQLSSNWAPTELQLNSNWTPTELQLNSNWTPLQHATTEFHCSSILLIPLQDKESSLRWVALKISFLFSSAVR